jgi:hypothetical protein
MFKDVVVLDEQMRQQQDADYHQLLKRTRHRFFEKEVQAKWSKPENRVLGFTLLSPPIVPGATPGGYTTLPATMKL